MKKTFIISFVMFIFIVLIPIFAQVKSTDGNFDDWTISDLLASDYLNDSIIDTCDIYQLYVYDDADSIYIRIVFGNSSNLGSPNNGGFFGDFHVFISVDPIETNNFDNTGLRYGYWSNGYDYLFSKGWWSNNFKWYKYNDPNGNNWDWIDSNRICPTEFNSTYNDVEFSFPKEWIRYPNFVQDFPPDGYGFIAIYLAANRGFSPYEIVDTLARLNTNHGGIIYTLTSPLPVELVEFTAKYIGSNKIELNWSTLTETNNYGFEIERASLRDNKERTKWEKIGFVSGYGTSNSPKNYVFVDNNAYYGIYRYRLKQVDIDGNYKYSNYVEINTGSSQVPVILEQNYPNPFNPITFIKFVTSENKHVSLKVYNLVGQEIATLYDGIAEANKVYKLKFNGENLPSGLYFYELRSDNFVKTNKMLLIK